MKPMHMGPGATPPSWRTITAVLGSSDRTNVSIGSTLMSDRLFRLMERHQRLDDRLRLAQSRRLPDPFEVMRLKKLKLVIKDRLQKLRRKGLTAG